MYNGKRRRGRPVVYTPEFIRRVLVAYLEMPNPTTESRKAFFKEHKVSKATFNRLRKEYGITATVKKTAILD